MNEYTIIYMLISGKPESPVTKSRNFKSEYDLLGALDYASSKAYDANPGTEVLPISIKLNNPPPMLGGDSEKAGSV